jgi:RNA polymerase-binding transcription factor
MTMADEVIEITRARKNERTRRLLTAELNGITARLHAEAEVPMAGVVGGDFLDVAQGVEHQEQARLSASRLMERARRLRVALTRVADGEYGICSECGTAIPSKRLLAVPDATTCVACQSRLERITASARGDWNDAEHSRKMSA